MRITARLRWSGLRAAQREPRSLGVAGADAHLERAAARLGGQHVLAGEQSLQALHPREARQGLAEPTVAEGQHAAGMVEHDLGARVGHEAERFLGPREMGLRFGQPPHPQERHASHRERAGRHRLARPAMFLGDRKRPFAQLERERQRLTGERGRDREMREAAGLEERPWDPARVAEGVLQVLPGVVGTAGPQLDDAEIDEHECAVVGQHRRLVRRRGAERRFQAARRFLSPAQIAVPAGELDLDDGQVHVEQAPSLRRSRRRESSSDAQVSGGLVEPPVEDAVDGERSREVSVGQAGIRREHGEQRVERFAPAGHRQRVEVVHQQAPGRCPVTGRLIVAADGLDYVAVLFVPHGRGAVQRRKLRLRHAPQFEAQEIREQVVVAEPRTGGIERGDERVLVLPAAGGSPRPPWRR